MHFKIYVIGAKLDKFYLEAIQEYTKRLSRYCKTSLALLKSGDQLAKNLSSKSHVVLITPNGTSLTSEDFADQINTWGISGISEIAFIIGESDFESDSTLALTSMEMDSGLSATVVFEQIYRAYRILNNQPYHK